MSYRYPEKKLTAAELLVQVQDATAKYRGTLEEQQRLDAQVREAQFALNRAKELREAWAGYVNDAAGRETSMLYALQIAIREGR